MSAEYRGRPDAPNIILRSENAIVNVSALKSTNEIITMKITYNYINKSKFISPTKKITKNTFSKTKTLVKDYEKRAGFMAKPIKYYLIGLAIPIPFASTVGFIWGLGKATYDKISRTIKK